MWATALTVKFKPGWELECYFFLQSLPADLQVWFTGQNWLSVNLSRIWLEGLGLVFLCSVRRSRGYWEQRKESSVKPVWITGSGREGNVVFIPWLLLVFLAKIDVQIVTGVNIVIQKRVLCLLCRGLYTSVFWQDLFWIPQERSSCI